MSITPESGQLQTLIEALSRGEEPQARDGKPGDPQLSALCQFLIQSELVHSDVIVDFGSGNGVLAEYLSRVWPESTQVPEYWAIDLPEMLDQLSLPSRVHNSSRKYTSEEFYKDVFPVNKDRIKLIVIRNTLHELDVIATSQLFDTIRLHLSATGWVYIQDMARLKKPERRNVVILLV